MKDLIVCYLIFNIISIFGFWFVVLIGDFSDFIQELLCLYNLPKTKSGKIKVLIYSHISFVFLFFLIKFAAIKIYNDVKNELNKE